MFEAFFACCVAAEVLLEETFVEEHVEGFERGLGSGTTAPICDLVCQFDEAFAHLGDDLIALLCVLGEELFEFGEDIGSHANVFHRLMGFTQRELEGFDYVGEPVAGELEHAAADLEGVCGAFDVEVELALVEDERPVEGFEVVADYDASFDEGGELLEGKCRVDAFLLGAFAGDAVDFFGILEAGPGFVFGGLEDAVELFVAFESCEFDDFIEVDVEAGGFDVDYDRGVLEECAEGIAVAMGCGQQEIAQAEADFFGEGA